MVKLSCNFLEQNTRPMLFLDTLAPAPNWRSPKPPAELSLTGTLRLSLAVCLIGRIA